jgi:hypothetical protein
MCKVNNLPSADKRRFELFTIFAVNGILKYISFILTLYLLMLIVISCVDVHMDHRSQYIEFSQNTTNNNHRDADFCSPFCTCNCCVSPVIIEETIIQYNHFMLPQEHHSCYISVYNSSQFASIWQPPKLS